MSNDDYNRRLQEVQRRQLDFNRDIQRVESQRVERVRLEERRQEEEYRRRSNEGGLGRWEYQPTGWQSSYDHEPSAPQPQISKPLELPGVTWTTNPFDPDHDFADPDPAGPDPSNPFFDNRWWNPYGMLSHLGEWFQFLPDGTYNYIHFFNGPSIVAIQTVVGKYRVHNTAITFY